ncbi:glutathione S-transferase T3-like [Arachis stenosperma]|uniref:glutathione S-transferase T3-like n=1 Tax=Arachis stenosperma TaxID=217475 RepID=UPI0025AC3B66|nr:glutathione S-transferase T3-like [Arachis stenosperma]
MTRGVVSCKKRWYKINKVVAQFAGCYDQASRNIRSGSNADDIKELAYKLYSTYYDTPLADKPGVDSPIRPQGSKKSKRKGKEKAQISEDLSKKKSSVVKKLSLMEDIKNVREKELMDREKEREEERAHRAKIMAMKEKELQIQVAMKEQELQTQAAMKEQELRTQRYIKEMEINAKERKMEMMSKEREREMDMQILNADTSIMSEIIRVDATRRRGLSPLQECTAAIRMLAYGVAADVVDDYVRIGERTTIESLEKFVEGVFSVFEDEYLRKPNPNDVRRLLQMVEGRGFPGMLVGLTACIGNEKIVQRHGKVCT